MSRIPRLNPAQLEILAWVRDGSPEDAYNDYRPRIIARALHNRGLVAVIGHGKNWNVSLTDDGAFYLKNGTYPPKPKSPAPVSAVPTPSAIKQRPAKSVPKSRERKTPRVGPTDAMMAALIAADDHQIEIGYDESSHYSQLAKTAERFNKIPDGMQVTVSHDYQTRTAQVVLHSLPEWRTRLLAAVNVPGALRGMSDTVKALQAREDVGIRSSEMNRTLRLAQALVSEAERRGYKVAVVKPPKKNQWGYFDRNDQEPGHLKFTLGPDDYRLRFVQLTEKRAHVATKSELARAGRGYALPTWDHVPTGKLGIRIDTIGVSFWGQSWADRDDRSLEEALAQILQELELRHDASVDRRVKEAQQRDERKRQWEIARENAIQALTDSHRAELLAGQVADWREVAAIREYAGELEQRWLVETDQGKRLAALEWVQWARDFADRTDPLRRQVRLPPPPEPTHTALQPFMRGWSAYGPN
jgi:hypothetical protein